MLAGLTGALPGSAQVAGVDTGGPAEDMAQWNGDYMAEWGATRPYLRIRARQDLTDLSMDERRQREQVGYRQLRHWGFRPLLFVHWSAAQWKAARRPGGGHRVPLDLREAFERAKDYGGAYGGGAAGFEIDNEPDIDFVQDNAETFLAFQKAVYLGLKRGVREATRSGSAAVGVFGGSGAPAGDDPTGGASVGSHPGNRSPGATGEPAEGGSEVRRAAVRRQGRPADRWERAGHRAAVYRLDGADDRVPRTARRPEAPLVVMAPLALPPGPYFEQLVANGLFSYTDAFNYHFYGYAEDFTGVYRQFEAAVHAAASARPAQGGDRQVSGAGSEVLPAEKRLPVLLTEYGYGGLAGEARDTVPGRVRQWRWFQSVGRQIQRLRIAGPMAFYLPPYFERKELEFGLSVRPAAQPPLGGSGAAAVFPPSRDSVRPSGSADGGRNAPTDSAQRIAEGRGAAELAEQADGRDLPARASKLQASPAFTAGNLTYTPQDFGLKRAEPWMRYIGMKFGENEATPALAWLFDQGRRHPYVPKDWIVSAPPPSPVVIDFIAGDGLVQAKRYGGYLAVRSEFLVRPPAEGAAGSGLQRLRTGDGELVLYNFSSQPVTGHLRVTAGRDLLVDPDALTVERTLAPMDRVLIPIKLRVPTDRFAENPLTLRFDGVAAAEPVGAVFAEPEGGSPGDGTASSRAIESAAGPTEPAAVLPPSIFSTAFYPEATGMRERVLVDFRSERSAVGDQGGRAGPPARIAPDASAPSQAWGATQSTRALLRARPLAAEEPQLVETGTRWLATPGVRVEETADGTWRFTIERLPDTPKQVASVELPLPPDFEFPDDGMFIFSYRLAAPAASAVPIMNRSFEPYFRTANGNLYQVWPRQYATGDWQRYTEIKRNFTMAFYGRAALPWRFADNRPVALVFFFRPGEAHLPATFEIKEARIVSFGAAGSGSPM